MITKIKINLLFLFIAFYAGAADLKNGGFFLLPKDIQRFKTQKELELLAPVYAKLKTNASKSITAWRKKFPATKEPLDSATLIKRATDMLPQQKYERAIIFVVPDYRSVAMQTILEPTAENKEALREMLLAAIGVRRKFNYWREYGIHEAENLMRFLTSMDMALQVGALNDEDIKEIRDEMNRAGHFMEGWLLDNDFSRMYGDSRIYNYCINFHIVSAVALNSIANIFSDLDNAKTWESKSHVALLQYLFDGYTEDGGYGEGSINYWGVSNQFLEFFVLNKNLGKFDYTLNPFFQQKIFGTNNWRIHLTAPDGLSWAVGDGHRIADDVRWISFAAKVFNESELVWATNMMIERAPKSALTPELLLHYDANAKAEQIEKNSDFFPYAGYAMLRSGWKNNANAAFFKYGITYTGRRLSERNAVISGHAHQDALMMELHYNGKPVLVDIGTRGAYSDWHTYGGFMKATIGHSTVGLGNKWGYDRFDGKYQEHIQKHLDFTYEEPQQNINPADTRLTAFGDLGAIAFTCAKVRTYDQVEHERGIIWFPEDSLTIVADSLISDRVQPYEWYFTPIGKTLDREKLIFGDDVAKLQILPMSKDLKITAISRDTPNIPPYYVGLVPPTKPSNKIMPRWDEFSLLIMAKKAQNIDLINILMPFEGEKNPWIEKVINSNCMSLQNGNREVIVNSATKDNRCGVVLKENNKIEAYSLLEGNLLSSNGKLLFVSQLESQEWNGRYSPKVNVAISLKNKQANIEAKRRSGEEHLEFYAPKKVTGQEAELPIALDVSFYIGEKPKEMLIAYNLTHNLKFDDQEFANKINWRPDVHNNAFLRVELPFVYDEATQMVKIKVSPNTNRIIWR